MKSASNYSIKKQMMNSAMFARVQVLKLIVCFLLKIQKRTIVKVVTIIISPKKMHGKIPRVHTSFNSESS